MNQRDMTDRTVLITGANSGIGKATAAALATRGAHLILACRNPTRAQQARTDIHAVAPASWIDLVEMDVAVLDSVNQAAGHVAELVDTLDVLINNAGATITTRSLTSEGFERTFAKNYLGHYALTKLLLPSLLRADGPRVLTVSSDGHKFTRGIRWDDLAWERGHYSATVAYANAKLAEVLFTTELARRYGPEGLFAGAVHPGFVGSSFYGNAIGGRFAKQINTIMRPFAKSSEQGAATSVYLACAPEPLTPNGGYWAKCAPAHPSKAARDQHSARRLWTLSAQLVGQHSIELSA